MIFIAVLQIAAALQSQMAWLMNCLIQELGENKAVAEMKANTTPIL